MLANSAVGAALVFVVAIFGLLARTAFLAPFRRLIIHDYGWMLLAVAIVSYLNLVAVFYLVSRVLFLRASGQKLTHIDRQLGGADTIAAELSAQLTEHAQK